METEATTDHDDTTVTMSPANQEMITKDLQDLQSGLAVVSKELESEFEIKDRDHRPEPDWKAAAVGGFLSFAKNAAAQSANNTQQPKSKTFTFAAVAADALKAAQTSAQVHQQERTFHAQDMQIQYVAGNPGSAKRLGFVIHGFMTAEESEEDVSNQWREWAEMLDMVLYRVCWPTGSKDGWISFADKAFQKTNNNNARGPRAINNEWVSQLTSNPWDVAQDKTIQVGAVLARFLQRPPETLKKYMHRSENNSNGGTGVALIGHSLGAAIVFQTLLQAETSVMVDQAIFLGGAFVPTVTKIEKVLSHVRGKYVNVFSKNDRVLNIVYRAANINCLPAAGNIPILTDKQMDDEKARRLIMDLDMTQRIRPNEATIQGHSYAQELPFIADTLRTHGIFDPSDVQALTETPSTSVESPGIVSSEVTDWCYDDMGSSLAWKGKEIGDFCTTKQDPRKHASKK